MDFLENEYMTILKEETKLTVYRSTEIYFQFWKERHSFLQILIRNNLFHKLFIHYKKIFHFSFISNSIINNHDIEFESYKFETLIHSLSLKKQNTSFLILYLKKLLN